MSFLTLAERNHGCSLELPGGEQDCLERFLQKPKRTMTALLSRERMKPLGQGRFRYQSRAVPGAAVRDYTGGGIPGGLAEQRFRIDFEDHNNRPAPCRKRFGSNAEPC